MSCPHKDKRFCPLYIASHLGGGQGCDDGRLDEGGCGCAREMNYAVKVEELRASDPRLVAELEFREEVEIDRLTRLNNMRLNGVH